MPHDKKKPSNRSHYRDGDSHERAQVELDQIDRKLLRIMQKNNRLTNLELAELAYLSPPTCLRRVRRLREEKVIIGDVALLDPSRVGQNFFVFTEVVLERQGEELQRAFEVKMDEVDEVMQCYMVSGDSDFMLVIQVADMNAYHRFVRRELTNDPNIRNFRSMFAMNRSKFRTEISIDI
jgi:Lrp/AsnC family leucine-responsive transcriptional regulator